MVPVDVKDETVTPAATKVPEHTKAPQVKVLVPQDKDPVKVAAPADKVPFDVSDPTVTAPAVRLFVPTDKAP
jgi:hypothetical protein